MQVNQILLDDWNYSVLCKTFSKKWRDWVKIEISSRWWTAEFSVDREYLWSISDQLRKANEILTKNEKVNRDNDEL